MENQMVHAIPFVVCYTAVFSVVTQRSSPTILIILSFTHGAPIKAKLWLEESQYRKRGANTFQKMGAEL